MTAVVIANPINMVKASKLNMTRSAFDRASTTAATQIPASNARTTSTSSKAMNESASTDTSDFLQAIGPGDITLLVTFRAALAAAGTYFFLRFRADDEREHPWQHPVRPAARRSADRGTSPPGLAS
ncbi:hypothetical protein [Sphingomonas sp. Leaf205]|uniref:hypothetical protein n=1 Tax=Sphingomonas sp. Leaf205 TaxID=2876551 RepID=UPI001E307C2A|nr:hypothetical protein [Sphingomonas sp. Leaf205]